MTAGEDTAGSTHTLGSYLLLTKTLLLLLILNLSLDSNSKSVTMFMTSAKERSYVIGSVR